MNCCETSGQMSVQCGSMDSSTTTLPRKRDSGRARPFWSMSVNPGAGLAGTGDSPIRLMVPVGTLAGMPEGRWPATDSRWCQRTAMIAAADATMRTAATVPVISHLRLAWFLMAPPASPATGTSAAFMPRCRTCRPELYPPAGR
jgi:hypothetical protein